MSEFVAYVDERDKCARWMAVTLGPNGVKTGQVYHVRVCPTPNPNADTRVALAAELRIHPASIIKMQMVRMGKTDRLGDAGWQITLAR